MNRKGIQTEILAYIIIGVIVLGLVYWGMSSAFGNTGILGAFKNILPGFPGIKEPSNFGEDNIVVDATGQKIRYSIVNDKVYSRESTSWREINSPSTLEGFRSYWCELRRPNEIKFTLGGNELTAKVLKRSLNILTIDGENYRSCFSYVVTSNGKHTEFILSSEDNRLFVYEGEGYKWANTGESIDNYKDLIEKAVVWQKLRLYEPVLIGDKKYCPESPIDYYDREKSIVIDLTKPFEGENCYE